MPHVECSIVRWVSDEPQPGPVEVEVVDADEVVWRFVDKSAIFSAETLTASTLFPRPGAIRCERGDDDGTGAVWITTASPDAVEASDGTTYFRVPAASVR
jgi:hypothetical protein